MFVPYYPTIKCVYIYQLLKHKCEKFFEIPTKKGSEYIINQQKLK